MVEGILLETVASSSMFFSFDYHINIGYRNGRKSISRDGSRYGNRDYQFLSFHNHIIISYRSGRKSNSRDGSRF